MPVDNAKLMTIIGNLDDNEKMTLFCMLGRNIANEIHDYDTCDDKTQETLETVTSAVDELESLYDL